LATAFDTVADTYFGCQLLCIIGLASVLLFVPFWDERSIAGIGLLIALIVLPLYVPRF